MKDGWGWRVTGSGCHPPGRRREILWRSSIFLCLLFTGGFWIMVSLGGVKTPQKPLATTFKELFNQPARVSGFYVKDEIYRTVTTRWLIQVQLKDKEIREYLSVQALVLIQEMVMVRVLAQAHSLLLAW